MTRGRGRVRRRASVGGDAAALRGVGRGDAPLPVLCGYHPVREALRRRPHQVEEVWVTPRRGGGRRAEVEALCRRHGIAVQEVPATELDRLAPVHNGFAARVREEALSGVRGAERDEELVVLLEDVQDPRNLGAVLRVCEGTGVGRVMIRDRGSAPLTAVAVKAAAGATEWLTVERVVNAARSIEGLKEAGYWVYGADPGGVAPWELDLRGKVAFCLGGEGRGLRRLTRESCDALVGLPMRGRVESLNVATAAAALLYEAVRQRVRLPAE